MNDTHRLGLLLAALLSLSACGGTAPPAEEPDPTPAETASPTEPESPDAELAERPTLSAEECAAQGGEVVGDIGDGAIHRPDYVCPSGAPPIGSIPLGVEGSVCCR